MGPAAVVESDVAADPGAGLGDTGVDPQVDLLVFDGSPQPLHEDVVAPGALAIHADPDLAGGQNLDEVGGGELTALVAVEDLALVALAWTGLRIARREGAVLLTGYVAYVYVIWP